MIQTYNRKWYPRYLDIRVFISVGLLWGASISNLMPNLKAYYLLRTFSRLIRECGAHDKLSIKTFWRQFNIEMAIVMRFCYTWRFAGSQPPCIKTVHLRIEENHKDKSQVHVTSAHTVTNNLWESIFFIISIISIQWFATGWTTKIRFPARRQILFSSQPCKDWLWRYPASNRRRGVFRRGIAADAGSWPFTSN
jgi:hypothetical protein